MELERYKNYPYFSNPTDSQALKALIVSTKLRRKCFSRFCIHGFERAVSKECIAWESDKELIRRIDCVRTDNLAV